MASSATQVGGFEIVLNLRALDFAECRRVGCTFIRDVTKSHDKATLSSIASWPISACSDLCNSLHIYC
jgi:hypothetical protein